MTEDIKALFLAFVMLGLLSLAACAHDQAPPPEPIIRTVEVQVPVVQPCPALERVGPAPAYPDTDAALALAADIYVQVQLLLAGREKRVDRLETTERALEACR